MLLLKTDLMIFIWKGSIRGVIPYLQKKIKEDSKLWCNFIWEKKDNSDYCGRGLRFDDVYFLLLLLVNTNKNKKRYHLLLLEIPHCCIRWQLIPKPCFTPSKFACLSQTLWPINNLLRTIETKDFAPHMIGLVLGTTLIIEVICWGLIVAQIFNCHR